MVISRGVLAGIDKAKHLAGKLQRDSIERNLYGEKALNCGLERNRNSE